MRKLMVFVCCLFFLTSCKTLLPFTQKEVRDLELQARGDLCEKYDIVLDDEDYTLVFEEVSETIELSFSDGDCAFYRKFDHKLVKGLTVAGNPPHIILPCRFLKSVILHEMRHVIQLKNKIFDPKHTTKIWEEDEFEMEKRWK